MIRSFGNLATADIYIGRETKAARQVPTAIWPVLRPKLDAIHRARTLADLRLPAGNRLEALKGDRQGSFSLRVNDKYRVTFRFEGGYADDVACEDYH